MFIIISKCNYCNFVSDNITFETNPQFFNVLKSKEYNALLSNDYDADISYSHPSTQSLCLNFYDAYAYLCKQLNQVEKYVVALFKCASLKDILLQKYYELKYTCADDVNKYENVINKLSQSKNNDLTEILRVCENINNEYLKCVKCESLIMLEEFAKARMIIHSLKIDTSLKQYFINLINSYEVDL